MDSLFKDPLYLERINDQYQALRQTSSASTLATEFKALATILGKSESDKWFDFLEKLNDEVKVRLAGLLGPDERFDSITRKANPG